MHRDVPLVKPNSVWYCLPFSPFTSPNNRSDWCSLFLIVGSVCILLFSSSSDKALGTFLSSLHLLLLEGIITHYYNTYESSDANHKICYRYTIIRFSGRSHSRFTLLDPHSPFFLPMQGCDTIQPGVCIHHKWIVLNQLQCAGCEAHF